MKQSIRQLFLCVFAGAACVHLPAENGTSEKEVKVGGWCIRYDAQGKGVDIRKGTKSICEDLYASYRLSGKDITSRSYARCAVSTEKIRDSFGKGYRYQVTYTDAEYPTLVHSFYLYPEHDYLLTECTLESKEVIASNHVAPVNMDKVPGILNQGENNRALFVPFDNDKWIRYQSHPLTFDRLTSYEVTAVFNNDDRHALVVGSVEHDIWKTAVSIGKGTLYNIGSLSCYGGVADEQTRDSKPHGAVDGTRIKSPKVFVGYFADWRVGLETYAQANAVVAPPRKWEGAVPFGWNSWGALQFDLTYPKAVEVSDFFMQHIQNNAFKNPDGIVYIGLDSGWNSFKEEDLQAFVDRCKANGQKAGTYWTPFTDWGRNPEATFDSDPKYKFKDVYLYANGKPQELDGAYALDPTHPAVEASMKKMSERFRRLGFEYVKMDFMTHGAMEADKWYRPEIHTGIQGYNYGMQLLESYFNDMYLNLSISPVFPAHYAQSRRIACDAWNKIKDTEYTLNALSYGWWQDKVYRYNDADHIVLRDATEGENRARVTSGVITGVYIAGDDFSAGGKEEDKAKARKFLTNARVNALATGVAFRPVNGNGAQSENEFVRIDSRGNAQLAVFNYSENELRTTVSLDRIGLNPFKEYKTTELWSGKETRAKGTMSVVVPAKDVLVFEIIR